MPMTAEDLTVLRRQISRAEGLGVGMLACRVGGDRHHWVQCEPDFSAQHGIPIVHQCSRCDTIKRVVISPAYGEVLARTYQYPDGYELHREEADGENRLISSAAVRVSMYRSERPLAALREL